MAKNDDMVKILSCLITVHSVLPIHNCFLHTLLLMNPSTAKYFYQEMQYIHFIQTDRFKVAYRNPNEVSLNKAVEVSSSFKLVKNKIFF